MARHRRGSGGCCSVEFLRYALFVYNVIFLAAGLFVLGVSIWTLIDRYQYVALLATATYPIITYFLLAAGTLVVIFTIIGCIATKRENRRLLLLYIFFLLLIFLMEAMVGILAFVYLEQVHNELEMNLNKTFVETYGIVEEKTYAIDFLQEEFHCCGATIFEDWNQSRWRLEGLSNENLVPDSCCKTLTAGCGKRTHPSNINFAGCLKNMEKHLVTHLGILSGVGLGICALQIFGICFACCLYCKIRDDESEEDLKPL